MYVESKAWNWGKNSSDKWNVPSEISYYLIHRWKDKNLIDLLDLGCGLGRHSFQFAKAGFNVNAFDLSAEAITNIALTAKESNLAITTYCGDMLHLPYPDNSMDCLLAYHVLSHTDSKGIEQIISEIKRVLKANGEFYITLCSKNAWSYKDAGFKRIDENTVLKEEDGPENGIPHYFADDSSINILLKETQIESMRHTKDIIVDQKPYASWHYFILGINKKGGI